MKWLAVGPRGHNAGDILLLSRTGMDRPIEERFYFSGPYRSWHGSPTEADSAIPLLVINQSLSGEAIAEWVRAVLPDAPSQLDVVPLVAALLGQKLREAPRARDAR